MKPGRFLLPLLCAVLLIALLIVGQVLGQDEPETSFPLTQRIGRVRPQGIQYDPNFDRLVMVDAAGQLVLVDAATFEVQHVLYAQGTYNTYRFSHDGRWLALGIGRRVELWDTQTGELAVFVEPDEALSIQDPFQFADDDGLLLINALVAAPAAIRVSENDTANLPYLWDLPAARDEAPSSLPRFFELYSFYDYRNGYVLGPNDIVIAALPQRLQILDVGDVNLPVLGEIASERRERDPISVWGSLRDDQLYVRPLNQNYLVQVNTPSGAQVEIPLGREMGYSALTAFDALALSDQARIIGQPNSRETNSLLRLLLGDEYRRDWDYDPLTVMLIDVLEPMTPQAGQLGLLIYIFDEQTGRGMFDFLRPPDANQIVLHPENTHLMVRRASGAQPIEVYNLDSGAQERTIYPALSDPEGNHLLAYNRTGEAILSDFQRFNATTGAVVNEALEYHPGFDEYYFTADSAALVTLSGSDWWQWDIATGEVVRREHLDRRGDLVAMSPDAHRFLSYVDTFAGPAMEILEMGTSERLSVVFEELADRPIEDIIPSPDWQNFIVVYAPSAYGQHRPGNEIALYNIRDGKRWFLAGDDLPPYAARTYGWIDNQTAYIYGEEGISEPQPARVYGIDYHSSGLPACLVETFPGAWPDWVDLWERLNATMRPDNLGRLALRLCDTLPADVEGINAVFYPSPTPTLPPITATPAVIAGVPRCLTQRFPNEAAEYARIWREMTVGMNADAVAELEVLMCEGLGESSARPPRDELAPPENPVQVMTINITTGQRTVGGYIPAQPAAPQRSLSLVLDAFEDDTNVRPADALLSPDGRLLAARTRRNHILIYRVLVDYNTLVTDATATAAPRLEDEPRIIAVRPTATQPFDREGEPRPTLTPTVTPTPPPRADEPVAQTQFGQVEDFCAPESLYQIGAPPPDYAATGRLLGDVRGSTVAGEVDTATGRLYLDETIPRCNPDTTQCSYSSDQRWLLWVDEQQITVMRPDGSRAQVLYHAYEQPVWPEDVYWLDTNSIEYRYRGYLPDETISEVALRRRFDPDSGDLSAPYRASASIRVNELSTEVVAVQPNNGSLAVVRTSFNTGTNTGYKYYIYDRDTGQASYFARLAEYSDNTLDLNWHPLGMALYYRYPGSNEWLIFDATTREHRVLGDLPGGVWSRDGHYRAMWITISDDEREARADAGLVLPKLRIWDSNTGLIRRYCIPETEDWTYDAALTWSPDQRYLAFRIRLPGDGDYETARARTLVLDTQTGHVTELSIDIDQIIVWMDAAPEGKR